MHGGHVDDWRELFALEERESPTYTADLAGELTRFDERDCVFARRDLQASSARYAHYYAGHPELRAVDDAIRTLPGLGTAEPRAVAAMGDAIFGSVLHLASEDIVAGEPEAARQGDKSQAVLAPEVAAAKVKGLAHLLGADQVGIGPLNPAFVYSHVGRTPTGQTWGARIELRHPYAISIGLRMNVAGLVRSAPHYPTLLESGAAYARGALIAVQLAAYIRGLGFQARAHHLRNYQVLSVPVAVDGGLGELGRCGTLISREHGNCLRIATVTTDLPLACDAPVDLGLQRFCSLCQACAKECPAGAIPTGPKVLVRGVRKWELDAEACYRYWFETGSDCALCVVVCPWSRWALGPRPTETDPPVPGSHLRSAARPAWLR
ncbi:MAG: 4Fe-4S dicluster domain-containing protein [Chloroflexota bacterium]